MSLPIHDPQAFDKFFHAIAPLADGYTDVDFRYLAIKQGDQWTLVQGRVIFNYAAAMEPKKNFKSENVACGRYTLAELKRTPEQIAKELLTGKFALPDMELIFPSLQGGNFCTSYFPLHPSGLSVQSRYNAATIYGADVDQIVRQPLLEWELRSNDTPYDTMIDLVADYRCGPLMSGAAAVEFAALQVVQTKYDSPVTGTQATPTLLAAKTLDPKKISMGYRVLSKGAVTARGNLNPEDFRWATEEQQLVGTASLTAPEAAIIQCFAKYNGIAQHHAWIHDKATTQNPRRSIYENIDPSFDVLKELLARRGKGKDAREFESGVAWLLWMMGFNMAQFGHMPNAQDAPDLIARVRTHNL